MANYIYRISSVKIGTPTGTNTMPASGDLTSLPNTVRGSVVINESDSTVADFYVDQLTNPVMTIENESGKLTAEMEFYDVDYTHLATLKGGTGNASGYAPPTSPTNVLKAVKINTVSDHDFDFYNAQVQAKVTGTGSNDQLFKVNVKLTALATTDGAGSWHVGPEA
jgi:hypothetical protein